MSDDKLNTNWDHTVDLLVVGTGAGAMTAALMAHDRGAKTLLIEKDACYGGSTAMSGGGLWVPNNHLMAQVGVDDTPDEALDYLKRITKGVVSEDRLQAYVKYAPEMIKYLCDNSKMDIQAVPGYADYFPEVPGGKPGARTCEPKHFNAKRLGDEFYRMRDPAPQTLIMKRVAFTIIESFTFAAKQPGWIKMMTKLIGRYCLDLRARIRSKRDHNLAFRNALIGMLRLSLMDRDVPLWLNTDARQLIVENGRVVGIAADRDGQTIRIQAEKGVVMAAGGFESNDEMRSKYLPNPTNSAWTCGSPQNTGDAIRMGLEVGAALDLMEHAWWGPTTLVPNEARARMLVHEKAKPRCVFVNKRGERYVNEATPYTELVSIMYEKNTPEAPCIPTSMIFDSVFRKKYPIGPTLPGAQQPDFLLPRSVKNGYLKKDMTLDGIAAKMGIDAEGLKATVEKMNEYARTGKDPDFHKGDSLYDRYYADQTVEPNPCLGPIDTPPYYGVEVHAGDIGTKGGLKTDASARVLSASGETIPGLYAIGNCSAAVMGTTYAGAGATIAPAMTFGYVAVLDALSGKG